MNDFEQVSILAHMYEAKSFDKNVYELAYPMPEKSEKEGFTYFGFFIVGRNASHEFSLAIGDSGLIYCRSTSEDDEHIKIIDNIDKTYIGHW